MCDHSNETYWALLSCGTYYAVQDFLLLSLDKTLVCDHSNESYWAVCSCDIMKKIAVVHCGKVIILKYYHLSHNVVTLDVCCDTSTAYS